MPDYIKYIRKKVGHEAIILVFAGAVVSNELGQILLHKRLDTGTWSLPGGAMEMGETAAEAAIREVKEETGLDIKIDELIGVYSNKYTELPNKDKYYGVGISFVASVVGGEIVQESDESSEVKFFDPDKIPKLAFKQHDEIVKDYLSGRRGVFN